MQNTNTNISDKLANLLKSLEKLKQIVDDKKSLETQKMQALDSQLKALKAKRSENGQSKPVQ